MLHPPDLTKPFQLWTDASKKGFGAVLEQTVEEGCRHPIAYASRATNDAEQKCAPTELEVAALVFALEHFQVYLLGNKVTDRVHRPSGASVILYTVSEESDKGTFSTMVFKIVTIPTKYYTGTQVRQCE